MQGAFSLACLKRSRTRLASRGASLRGLDAGEVVGDRAEPEGVAQGEVRLLHRQLGERQRGLGVVARRVRVGELDGLGDALLVEDLRLVGVLLRGLDGDWRGRDCPP